MNPVRTAPRNGNDKTGNALMLEKLTASAEEAADRWVKAFGLALAAGDDKALTELFLPDSHWRNLFGISWQFATFSGSGQPLP